MKKTKLKSLVKAARKETRNTIEEKITSDLKEITSDLGKESKKLSKSITKGAKQLSKKVARNIKIDKKALALNGNDVQAVGLSEGQPKEN